MKRPIELVADLSGGEIVQVHAGLVRILHRMDCSHRWALLLRDDLSETTDHLWLAPTTRVLEVVRPAAVKQRGDQGEVDPLRRGAW